ncbi:MAG: hypothetical protein LQ350_005085 [Teloschistes chrysophthalmus]|nr:MAG: hypothetical protein LQ350_005085 [Niorma chrysophthalma]
MAYSLHQEKYKHEDQTVPSRIAHWRMVFEPGHCTAQVLNHHYEGQGTKESPFMVSWLDDDSRNPYNWPIAKRAFIICCISASSLAASLSSSAYTGSTREIVEQFGISTGVATLGLSLFVLGFAVGPILFAPLSELYGRQPVFVSTYGALTIFKAGAAGSKNIQTLLVVRFFAGVAGSSPNTNAGAQIADMYGPRLVGLAMSLFVVAPFIGPALGPIIGGYIGENVGWRWVEGFLAAFTGAMWLLGSLSIPETYAPVLLRKRAATLTKLSPNNRIYISRLDVEKGRTSIKEVFRKYLNRPWVLLFLEPIVLSLPIYMAIIYGTLYMFFGAFPIVYQEQRHWSEGLGGLAFIGVGIGMVLRVIYAVPENFRYQRVIARAKGNPVPPEERLRPAMVGTPAIPIALFWFAWTNYPSLPPYASIAAGVPFGFGMVIVYLSITNYLVQSYVIFSASALAANGILRSVFGFAFPLFAAPMYHNLGIHWASCVPAFLALVCVPFPFVLFRYGHVIRRKCKYAKEAERLRILVQGPGGGGSGAGVAEK